MSNITPSLLIISGISITLSAYSTYQSIEAKKSADNSRDELKSLELKIKEMNDKYTEVTDYYLGIEDLLKSTEKHITNISDLYNQIKEDYDEITPIISNLDILDDLNSKTIFAKFRKQEKDCEKNLKLIELLRGKLSQVLGEDVTYEELKGEVS